MSKGRLSNSSIRNQFNVINYCIPYDNTMIKAKYLSILHYMDFQQIYTAETRVRTRSQSTYHQEGLGWGRKPREAWTGKQYKACINGSTMNCEISVKGGRRHVKLTYVVLMHHIFLCR